VKVELKRLDKVKHFEEDRTHMVRSLKFFFAGVVLVIWTICFVVLLISPDSTVAEKFQAFAVNLPWEVLSSFGG